MSQICHGFTTGILIINEDDKEKCGKPDKSHGKHLLILTVDQSKGSGERPSAGNM